MLRALAALLIAVIASGCTLGQPLPRGDATGRPNIVAVLVDDLDRESLSHLPRLRSLLSEQGATFASAFVSLALSGPSRAAILRGQYPHGFGIYSNRPPDGGFARFHQLGLEASTVATWLQDAGYHTALLGEYLNGYPGSAARTFVPPGWSDWYSPVGGNPYGAFEYELNENGRLVRYGRNADDHLTDVLARKAVDVVRRAPLDPRHAPLFLYVAPYAPHAPATPAPRHASRFSELTAPRSVAFDEEDMTDKPAWARTLPALSDGERQIIDALYRERLRSMLAVEDLVSDLIDALRQSGQLERTYFFFSSASGFHLGQHRLPPGKQTAYEEDVHVPLIVRGPGVPAGARREHLVLNSDLAPTWAEIAGVTPATFVDGRSFVPLLRGDAPALERWRSAVLIEHGNSPGRRAFPRRSASPEPASSLEPVDPDRPAPGAIPLYAGLRTNRYAYVQYVTGERELYDLGYDPDQLDNIAGTTDSGLLSRLAERLAALRGCREAGCRTAEGP